MEYRRKQGSRCTNREPSDKPHRAALSGRFFGPLDNADLAIRLPCQKRGIIRVDDSQVGIGFANRIIVGQRFLKCIGWRIE
jgi:hypothetical protein